MTEINGSGPYTSLLDTGASCLIINTPVLDAVGDSWVLTDGAISGIGDKIPKRASISEPLDVKISGAFWGQFKFHCLPDNNAGYDVILGRDFLNKFEVEIFPCDRKIKVGCIHKDDNKSAFTIYRPDKEGVTANYVSNAVHDVTCVDIPCYLTQKVSLSALTVNEIHFAPDIDYVGSKGILKNKDLFTYLEISPELTGLYPNMGKVNSNFRTQVANVLASVEQELEKGYHIGYLKSNFIKDLPKDLTNWSPTENCIYTIMTDQ